MNVTVAMQCMWTEFAVLIVRIPRVPNEEFCGILQTMCANVLTI